MTRCASWSSQTLRVGAPARDGGTTPERVRERRPPKRGINQSQGSEPTTRAAVIQTVFALMARLHVVLVVQTDARSLLSFMSIRDCTSCHLALDQFRPLEPVSSLDVTGSIDKSSLGDPLSSGEASFIL